MKEKVGKDEDLQIQEEIDDFPDYKFEHVWQQKCWDILYRLYFMLDSGPFIAEISEEAFGPELWEDYTSIIETPINLPMIKARMI